MGLKEIGRAGVNWIDRTKEIGRAGVNWIDRTHKRHYGVIHRVMNFSSIKGEYFLST